MAPMALPFPHIRPWIFATKPVHVGGLTLGPFALRWYALGYIVGILLGWRYALGLARNVRLWGERGPPADGPQIDDLILWLTLGVILGGRIGYIVFYMLPLARARATLAADPFEVLRLWHGGMSFHGGFLGVAIAAVWFARTQKIDLLRLGDLIAPCAPIGIALVRVANFVNGELWGRVTSVPWGVVFCGPTLETYANGVCVAGEAPRHPSQLYEAGLEGVMLFLILRLATHRAGWLARPGAVTGLFVLVYGLSRIALENVRMPDEGFQNLPLGLTMGMMLSAPMVAVGAALIWRAHRPAPGPSASARPSDEPS